MTNNWAGVVAYAKNHPTNNGQNWDGRCEAFVCDAGGFTNAFNTATLELAHASKLYTPSQISIGKAPQGWLYHWAFVGSNGVDYGHVGFSDGAGNALMASGYVENAIHSNLGYIKAADYEAHSGHHFIGTSPDHGGQYLTGVAHSIPAPASKKYAVKSGDSLSSIAAAHQTTWQKIYALNQKVIGSNPNAIKVGEVLTLP